MNMSKENVKKRDAVIPELVALEKKHGQEIAISAKKERLEKGKK